MMRSRHMTARLIAGVILAACMLPAFEAEAAPARIILLRHGEKAGPWQLCALGRERARALAAYYLGRNAQKSLFRPGETPKAILAISMHTLDTIFPVAESWEMPVTFYSAMPEPRGDGFHLSVERLSQRTREAVRDILNKPGWAGQTLVVDWEHDHIAKTDLDRDRMAAARDVAKDLSEPVERVTLYDLLRLDRVPGVPYTWPGDTYDYFWIIDFDAQTGQPSAFTMVKQEFGPPFAAVPHNDWGKPEGGPPAARAGCT
ncbi:histidine phosphatase family protein [Xanthobacter autotrophicus]|uniref:histidine phosphatase family protein n=1 Tax=Xanthobacter TaxID=279 RepID=UPI0024AAF7E7|nr:histidine phosphatase family protein [Xanthobacter autotrophicus]MDI4665536.1 histidine phosphatase family protein [Xanthobacter autotrophicus]